MKPYGEPLIAHFGLNSAKTAGYTLVQLIETSSITAHFREEIDAAYLNVFSCRHFCAETVARFCGEFFAADSVRSTLLVRN